MRLHRAAAAPGEVLTFVVPLAVAALLLAATYARISSEPIAPAHLAGIAAPAFATFASQPQAALRMHRPQRAARLARPRASAPLRSREVAPRPTLAPRATLAPRPTLAPRATPAPRRARISVPPARTARLAALPRKLAHVYATVRFHRSGPTPAPPDGYEANAPLLVAEPEPFASPVLNLSLRNDRR